MENIWNYAPYVLCPQGNITKGYQLERACLLNVIRNQGYFSHPITNPPDRLFCQTILFCQGCDSAFFFGMEPVDFQVTRIRRFLFPRFAGERGQEGGYVKDGLDAIIRQA
jgi:hypothetical protein